MILLYVNIGHFFNLVNVIHRHVKYARLLSGLEDDNLAYTSSLLDGLFAGVVVQKDPVFSFGRIGPIDVLCRMLTSYLVVGVELSTRGTFWLAEEDLVSAWLHHMQVNVTREIPQQGHLKVARVAHFFGLFNDFLVLLFLNVLPAVLSVHTVYWQFIAPVSFGLMRTRVALVEQ